ncbi:MAG: sigma-54-dependent Fis family transcriptional regulator [Planctomycetes bacterium]|nr:sigma-54-dependent Fis family transcriptional regulator [Planctomycetota bacterium]
MPRILVVDDEEAIRSGLAEILVEEGYTVEQAANAEAALARVREELFDLVCTDVRMPGMDGLELVERVKQESPETELIVITGFASLQSAVDAVKRGAEDYLSKPFDLDEVRLTVKRALEKKALRDKQGRLERRVAHLSPGPTLLGRSAAFQRSLQLLDRVAPTSSTVLILGETGTGKELVAREIHRRSPRASEPFIPINCGALPDSLLESELFGYAKGAFTGADKTTQGLFEAADRGTLFLDEIGNISLSMQQRLLRVLEAGELMRLGERKIRKVDVRIVAATNSDLKRDVEKGLFRQDFYYRLRVLSLELPPLRDRMDDLPMLAGHFLQSCAARFHKKIDGFSTASLRALQAHNWPGNIRELENSVEHAAILCVTPLVEVEDLPGELREKAVFCGAAEAAPVSLEALEKLHILKTLRECGGHRGRSAELLGINRRTLYRKLIEYGVAREEGDEDEGDDSPQPASH